jgi:hypothetical protein
VIRPRQATVVLLLLLVSILGACLRSDGPRPRAEDKRIRRVVPGVSTADEVVAALGRPNVRDDGATWIYEWQTTDPTVTFGMGSFGELTTPTGPVHSFYALVSFDESGRVARYEVQSDPPALAARLGAESPAPYAYLAPVQSFERSGCGERQCRPTTLAADGSRAVSPRDGKLMMWRVGAEALPLALGEFRGEDGFVTLSSDGDVVAFAVTGGEVVLFDTVAGRELDRVDTGAVTALALNGPGNRLAVATVAGELLLHDVGRGGLVARAALPGAAVESLDYSPTDPLVAAVDRKDTLILVAEDGAAVRRVVPGRPGRRASRQVRFSPDGRRLAVAGEVYVEVHDVEALVSGRSTARQVLLLPIDGPPGTAVPRAAFDAGSRRLAVISAGNASLWDWAAGRLLAILESPGPSGPLRPAPTMSGIAFRADGTMLTGGAGPIHEWDAASAEPEPQAVQRY